MVWLFDLKASHRNLKYVSMTSFIWGSSDSEAEEKELEPVANMAPKETTRKLITRNNSADLFILNAPQ